MASIDHEVIIFKNEGWLEQPFEYDEEYNYTNLCPFEYGRDGNIIKVADPFGNMVEICEEIRWFRDEYDAIYERDGWRDFCSVRKTPYGFWSWLKYKLHIIHRIGYRKEVGIWSKGDTEVYIYHDGLKRSYVSFYSNNTDTYIVIGGYGHWENVYCHFMSRGYGDEFEKKMASEAYRWACEDILIDISESVCETWEEEEELVNRMRERFKYDNPYKIVYRNDEEVE